MVIFLFFIIYFSSLSSALVISLLETDELSTIFEKSDRITPITKFLCFKVSRISNCPFCGNIREKNGDHNHIR
jgi:hypothetical protein